MLLEQPAYSGRVRYTPQAARQYQQRDERKHMAEMALVEKGFGHVPGQPGTLQGKLAT